MRAFAALTFMLWAAASLPAGAVGGSITDQAVTLTYAPSHWSEAPLASLVGTEPDPATDILYATGWWYRAEGDTREYALPPPDSEIYDPTAGQLVAHWGNLDGKLFQLWELVVVFDSEGPSGGLWSRLYVQNDGAPGRTLDVFHYLDVDVAGTFGGDSGQMLSPRYLKFSDGSAVVRYRARNQWRFAVAQPGALTGMLNDAIANDLENAGLPFPPGDVSAAFQFSVSPPSSQMAEVGEVSITSRLSGDAALRGALHDMLPWPGLLFRAIAGDGEGVAFLRRTGFLPGGQAWSVGPYRLGGADDFDGDLDNERVERDPASGETRIDFAPIVGAPALPLNWKLASTGDFDYDGKADILWRNTTSQKLVVWLMDGHTKVGTVIPSPAQAVDANWDVAGTGDFNGDGWRDLLWYNQTSGRIVLWYMDASVGRVFGAFTAPSSVAHNNWRVVAVGDYGKGPGGPPNTQDIVWQNDTSNRLVVWHMDVSGVRTFGTFTTPDTLPGAPALVIGPR